MVSNEIFKVSVPEFLVLQVLNKRVFRSICLFDHGLYLLKVGAFKSHLARDLHSAVLDDCRPFL